MARVSERNSGAPEWAQEHRQGQASNASAAPVKDKKEMEPRVPVVTDCHGVVRKPGDGKGSLNIDTTPKL